MLHEGMWEESHSPAQRRETKQQQTTEEYGNQQFPENVFINIEEVVSTFRLLFKGKFRFNFKWFIKYKYYLYSWVTCND